MISIDPTQSENNTRSGGKPQTEVKMIWVVGLLAHIQPQDWRLLFCAAHALFEQATLHVVWQTQLALGRK